MRWLSDCCALGQKDAWYDGIYYWCVDVGPDGVAYTYCGDVGPDAGGLSVDELPDHEGAP